MTLRRACAGLSVVVATAAGAESVRVSGTVLDSTRMRPLAGARVYAIPVDTGGRMQVTTDSAGRYSFDELSLGEYLLDVRHARRDSLGTELYSAGRPVPSELQHAMKFPCIGVLAFWTGERRRR